MYHNYKVLPYVLNENCLNHHPIHAVTQVPKQKYRTSAETVNCLGAFKTR